MWEKGMRHRDLKFGNIMIDERVKGPKIIDFGSAFVEDPTMANIIDPTCNFISLFSANDNNIQLIILLF